MKSASISLPLPHLPQEIFWLNSPKRQPFCQLSQVDQYVNICFNRKRTEWRGPFFLFLFFIIKINRSLQDSPWEAESGTIHFSARTYTHTYVAYTHVYTCIHECSQSDTAILLQTYALECTHACIVAHISTHMLSNIWICTNIDCLYKRNHFYIYLMGPRVWVAILVLFY